MGKALGKNVSVLSYVLRVYFFLYEYIMCDFACGPNNVILVVFRQRSMIYICDESDLLIHKYSFELMS